MTETELHKAAMSGGEQTCRKIYEENPQFLHVIDDYGRSPLFRAVFSGKETLVRFFLECGARFDIQANDGNTPLHDAAYYKRSSVVDVLLEWGAPTNILNKEGKTPAETAKEEGDPDLGEKIDQWQAFVKPAKR